LSGALSTIIGSAPTSTPTVQTTSADQSTTASNNPAGIAPAAFVQKTPTEPPPAGFTQVHFIGTKYTDYFTDGTTIIAVPDDPKIDGNLDKPNASIPTHAGMTWVHTTGDNLYDTPSGDLEVGEYAVQPDRSYVQNAPPFVSSTSRPARLPASTTNSTATDTSSTVTSGVSPAAPDGPTSTATGPSNSFSGTTTSSEPTTSPTI
jgi:hypothetical protein